MTDEVRQTLIGKVRQLRLWNPSLHVLADVKIEDLGQQVSFAAKVGVHDSGGQAKATGQVPNRDRGVALLGKGVRGKVQQTCSVFAATPRPFVLRTHAPIHRTHGLT